MISFAIADSDWSDSREDGKMKKRSRGKQIVVAIIAILIVIAMVASIVISALV